MDITERAGSRWGMTLPGDYLSLAARGGFRTGDPNYLALGEVKEWWDLEQLAGTARPDYWQPFVVPFARSAKGDVWGWNTDWDGPDGISTVYYSHDDDTGEGFAPTFRGAVYRLLLEDCCDFELLDRHRQYGDTALAVLSRNVERAGPILRASWSETLRGILDGYKGRPDAARLRLIDHDGVTEIIRRDLNFPHLDEEIEYLVESD